MRRCVCAPSPRRPDAPTSPNRPDPVPIKVLRHITAETIGGGSLKDVYRPVPIFNAREEEGSL